MTRAFIPSQRERCFSPSFGSRRSLGFLLPLWAALVALAIGGEVGTARAQQAPQMQVQADTDTVGVGDVLHVQLVVQGNAPPSDPSIGATPGFAVRGASSSPSETHININGTRIDRFSVTVDWSLQAQRVGTFQIGPFGIAVAGVRFQTKGIGLKVVPAGQVPPRQQGPQSPFPMPFGLSPFDPWKSLVQGMDPDDRAGQPAPSIDPQLSLDAPRGAFYFLHATVDKTSVVVGEQVTFSIYEYVDRAVRGIELDNEAVQDATVADFVKHPLLREDQDGVLAGYASVGGQTWKVQLIHRWALFPLRSGELVIGPMSVGLLRPRAAAGKRTTETVHVQVSEPPVAGRPPGYAVGDVGHFALTADATPRQIDQAAAVAVHAEIAGTGNLPASITAPVREGVEWLVPEVHDALGPQDHDRWGGKRTFDFVVRLNRAGAVDLGELRIPFWDPDAKRYEVARAPLGVVKVSPSASAAKADAPQEVLPGLPPARLVLEGAAGSGAHPDDTPLFWLLCVVAWPVAFGVAFAGRGMGVRAARAWHARATSPAAELRHRLAAARAASAGRDPRDADAATVRALHAATVAHAGVNVRGAAKTEDVVDRLSKAGVAPEAAAGIAELLFECEAARFAPDASDLAEATSRWARAQRVITQLDRRVR